MFDVDRLVMALDDLAGLRHVLRYPLALGLGLALCFDRSLVFSFVFYGTRGFFWIPSRTHLGPFCHWFDEAGAATRR